MGRLQDTLDKLNISIAQKMGNNGLRFQKAASDVGGKLINKTQSGGFGEKAQNIAGSIEGNPISMAKLAYGEIKEKIASIGNFASGMASAATKRSPFAAAEGGIKSVGKFAADNTLIGKVSKPLTDFAAGLIGSVDKLKNWNDQLKQSNFQFAQFSASMSAVQVRSENNRIALEQSKGEALAASAGRQSDASSRFNKAISPIENAWSKIQNDLSGLGINLLSKYVAEPVGKIFDKLNDVYDFMTGDGKPIQITDMESIIAGTDQNRKLTDWVKDQGKPKRF